MGEWCYFGVVYFDLGGGGGLQFHHFHFQARGCICACHYKIGGYYSL